MQNEGCDSQDSRNSDLLCLEDDLSKDLQEIIALEKIKSAQKSRKRGVTEYTYGSCGRVYSDLAICQADPLSLILPGCVRIGLSH